jgi:pyruvate formate lyase activating enzyme
MTVPPIRYLTPPSRADPLGPARCGLCPRSCLILPEGGGRCGVRFYREGDKALPYYGRITALAADPIEKKPLYHFRPGSVILSLGFSGCNLHCPFCQNWQISQNPGAGSRILAPEEAAAAALGMGFSQLAYTYSEPLIHAEYLLAAMEIARLNGVANVLVTNGCVQKGPAADILALTDAVNVDLKAFSKDTYERVLGGDMNAVLNFIALAASMGVHLEVTTLIVPGLNDKPEELGGAIRFLKELSPFIPWHLSAYHPDFHWDAPPTEPLKLAEIARRAREDLSYVYTGNIRGETNDTLCPYCGGTLVHREGYQIDIQGLVLKKGGKKAAYHCAACSRPMPDIRA